MGFVLEFSDRPGASLFNMPPERAIEFYRGKGLLPTFSYADLFREEHNAAFVVAKMMQLDLLNTVHKKVIDAQERGISIGQFRNDLRPILEGAGWWGKKPLVDPLTGNVLEAQLGSAYRLNNIYRSNLQSGYSVGRWERIQDNAQEAPWLIYDAVDDYRTREEHDRLDNTVLPVSDPFWTRFMPPNGYGCRCGVIQATDDELADMELKPSKPPRVEIVEWRNPRTGQIEEVPSITDPGWDHNPGLEREANLKRLARQKIETYPEDWQERALASIEEEEFFSGDSADMAWHRPSFNDSPMVLKQAVKAMKPVTVQQTPRSGAYAQLGRMVEMGSKTQDNAHDRAVWRHEFGHIMDAQAAKRFPDARSVGPYYSSGRDWLLARDADAKALLALTGRGRKSKKNDQVKAEREEAINAVRERVVDGSMDSSKVAVLQELAKEAEVDFDVFIDAMRADTLILDDVRDIEQIPIGAAVRLGGMLEALKRADLERFVDLGLYVTERGMEGMRAYRKQEALGSLSDLGGATTKNKVANYRQGFPGHSDAYYKRAPHFGPTEAFANITALMGHSRPFWHDVARRMTPAQVAEWEKLIEKLTGENDNG